MRRHDGVVARERKLPGKTEWAGRRRPMTRKSGFKAKAAVRLATVDVPAHELSAGESVVVAFAIDSEAGDRVGFGGWLSVDGEAEVWVQGGPPKVTISENGPGLWTKFGSQWVATEVVESPLLVVEAREALRLALFDLEAGRVSHPYLEDARDTLLKNMATFAPEGNFYMEGSGSVAVTVEGEAREPGIQLHLKSCNRCGRFLPVNLPDERATLSFSNHCVAAHRRPCKHTGFGRIEDSDTGETHVLDYGFQLECRFCKKFEVNAAHNPQRTADQMKEDAARRRAFELLLEHLYEGSPQLRFKQRTGEDLASLVYSRFDGRCFKCGKQLATERDMHLDHTRPLALLWPLDEAATALCADHNTAKRDRPPVEYYEQAELVRLAELTGLPLAELFDAHANAEAIDLLGEQLDWFFDEFLVGDELQKVRDGKRSADLLLKALDRAIAHYPDEPPFSVLAEAKRRGWDV